MMGGIYQRGELGIPKDNLKALDCWIRAVELGSAAACTCIADGYNGGKELAVNKERAALFWRIGALRGHIVARFNVGSLEYHTFGNHENGIRHWKIAAEAGHQLSLNHLKKIYNADGEMPGKEFISEEYLDFAHLACHEAQMEVKSEEREKHCTGYDAASMKC